MKTWLVNLAQSPRTVCLALGLLVYVIALGVYSLAGFEGGLRVTSAMYVYSGQQLAAGIPPYQSIFAHKGPIPSLIIGAVVKLSQIFGADELLGVRVAFLLITALIPAAIYLLVRELCRAEWPGIIAALVFISFAVFGLSVTSGPEPKMPMVLFQVLALLFTVRRQWMVAGVFGSLAFLTWQPTLIYPAITAALALAQSSGRSDRMKNVGRTVVGALIPVAVVVIYFLINGALIEFFRGFFLFNVLYLDRNDRTGTVTQDADTLLRLMFSDNRQFIVVGLIAIIVIPVYRIYSSRGIMRFLAGDRFAGITLSYPMPFLWSLKDFQGTPDFFIFLPYAAVGLGWLVGVAVQYLPQPSNTRRLATHALLGGVCIWLVFDSASQYGAKSQLLQRQRAWAQEALARFGNDTKVASIGLPEALVLLRKTNPSRYIVIIHGIDNEINATTDGGVGGWLEELEAYDPAVIFWGATDGRYQPEIKSWVERRYEEGRIGDWTIYFRDIEALSSRIAESSEAIKLRPDDAEAYFRRGVALKLRDQPGDHDKALADFRTVLDLGQRDAIQVAASRELRELEKEAFGGSFAEYMRAAKDKVGNGNYDGAIADYMQALTLRPDDAEAYFRRGVAYKLRDQPGDRDKARADFRKILELSQSTRFREEAIKQLEKLDTQS